MVKFRFVLHDYSSAISEMQRIKALAARLTKNFGWRTERCRNSCKNIQHHDAECSGKVRIQSATEKISRKNKIRKVVAKNKTGERKYSVSALIKNLGKLCYFLGISTK